MKIGDLWVSLGLKSDKKSFDKARLDLARFVDKADSKFATLGGSLKRALTSNVGTLKGITGPLKKVGIAAGVIGAGLVVAAKDALAFDDSLNRLDISSRGAMGSMEKVRSRVLSVSRATGVSKEELVAGSAAFVALTGDGKMASDSMETFAKVVKATGSPMEDVVGSAAALNEQLGIGAKDFERAFSILIAGGKAGKIELKDMASLTASLAAGYKQFGASKGIGGVATLGSAFQIVAKNFGSASEAATGLDSLMGSILQNMKDLKAIGVDPYEKDGKTLRSLEAITEDIGKKDLNATKVLGLLKRKEAVKTYNALHDNRRQWEEIRSSTLKANDVQEDYAKSGKSASAQISKSWNEIKVQVAAAFTPEVIGAFALAIKDAVQEVQDLATGLKGIGEWLNKYVGEGDETTVSRMEGDDALDDALRGGGNLDAIAAQEAPEKLGWFGGALMAGAGALGIEDNTEKQRLMIEAARARKAKNQGIAKTDAARYRKNFPGAAFDTNLNDPNANFLGNEGPVLPPDAGAGANTGSVTVSAPVNLTIHAPSGDAKAIAHEVKKAISEHHESMVRDLDAAAGGE